MEQKTSVRSTVKALILHDGKILLNRCYDRKNGEYYSLPGGGQNQYETLPEALIRECREETGYTVELVRFAALMEEICLDPEIRDLYAEYAHKMLHIFVCSLTKEKAEKPTETDDLQVACEWIPVESIPALKLLPVQVKKNFEKLMQSECPIFLGSVYLEHNHG
ncbi:MAG: NUDIX domain-containing protein [Eubacteriales bacterium]|nr:NUDIX domain-containing protein [Eubacteriales bacterium]